MAKTALLSKLVAAWALAVFVIAATPFTTIAAAEGYWRFAHTEVMPPQSDLDASDRANEGKMQRRISAAFQSKYAGKGTIELYFKTQDVDRKTYLSTTIFTFGTSSDMSILRPGDVISFEGTVMMESNWPGADATGSMAVDNGDYFVNVSAVDGKNGTSSGSFKVPGGGPGSPLLIHTAASLAHLGALSARFTIFYDWVDGPPPAPDQIAEPSPDAQDDEPGQTDDQSGQIAEPSPDAQGDEPGQTDDQSGQPSPGGAAAADDGNRVAGGEILGPRIEITEIKGWTGTWIRRPGTDIFDAVWHNADGSEASDVIRIVLVSGRDVVLTRDGNSGTYLGKISSDGRSIVGTASWYPAGTTWSGIIAGGVPSDGPISDVDSPSPDDDDEVADSSGNQADVPVVGSSSVKFADNWNTAACDVTDTATLRVRHALHLDRFELWINWPANERSARYRVFLRGRDIGGGVLHRGDCDPYQSAWCVGSDSPDVKLSAGRYELRIDQSALCQNAGSDGAGFIRAWGH